MKNKQSFTLRKHFVLNLSSLMRKKVVEINDVYGEEIMPTKIDEIQFLFIMLVSLQNMAYFELKLRDLSDQVLTIHIIYILKWHRTESNRTVGIFDRESLKHWSHRMKRKQNFVW